MVDIIDLLEINGFGLIRGKRYSRDQEHILEFVNLSTNATHQPWFYIDKTGMVRFRIIL